ncbi:MFS transporter [Frateuria aurantia]
MEQRLTEGAEATPPRGQMALGVAAVTLVALNLRTAVVSVSPLYGYMRQSFPVSHTAQGIMGTLPALCFALFGIFGPGIGRRLGLSWGIVLALLMIAAGEVLRAAISPSILVFGLISMLALGGIGLGNVLLPPAIKQLFPHHVGPLTSLYLVLIAVSAAIPPMTAIPLAHLVGWRITVGLWALLGVAGILPWAIIARSGPVPSAQPNAHTSAIQAWRWPTTWALTVLFAVGALAMYALIAWLPRLLTDSAGVTAATAGTMLAIYNFIGFPHSLLVPIYLDRSKYPMPVVILATACLCIGVLGLGFIPRWSWLWIIPAGLGAMFIPIGLTLINLRSRTKEGTTALSSFVQSAGYLISAAGPLLFGWLNQHTGSWRASCLFLAACGLAAGAAGVIAIRPVYIEDSV